MKACIVLGLVLALLPAAASAHSPFPSRGYLENGLAHTLLAPEQVVALVALGIGMAGIGGARLWLAMGAFAAAAIIGIMAADPIAFEAVRLLGPGMLATGGLALLAPARASSVTLPGLSAVAGFILGLAVYVDGPEDDGWAQFAAGAALSGGWLVAVAALLWRRIGRDWMLIPQRIAGSWLVAIAVLLAGAALNPRLRIDVEPAGIEVPSQPPGLDPSRQP